MVLRRRSVERQYLLRRRIAAGGMGEVYEAEAPDIGRRVAVKRMLDQGTDDEDLVRLFLREMMVASTLEHHNVVEVLDVGQSDHELFLVMEFVEGPTLAEVLTTLRRHNMKPPLQVACGIAMQIAQGLAHAHERALPDGTPLGIVHRDIAPENVLIGSDGVPKLVDFGLAKLDGQDLTQPGIIRGRPRSLAPEQARGDDTDARTDVFALGSILFEMTSGDRLYPDEAIATLLWRVAAGNYEPIRERMKDADPDLVAIVEKAVAVKPELRHRSARQFERELGAFQAARELRVTNSAVATLVASTWDEVKELRARSLQGSEGELDGQVLSLPADELEPIPSVRPSESNDRANMRSNEAQSREATSRRPSTPTRWKRPQTGPRPPGWDKVTPLPQAPARSMVSRERLAWNSYAWTTLALALMVFTFVWFVTGP